MALTLDALRDARASVRFIVGTPEQIAKGDGEEALTIVDARVRLGITGRQITRALRAGRLMPVGVFGNARLYRASDLAAVETMEPRSRDPRWATTAREAVRAAGSCAACGQTRTLEAHHVIPVAVRPDLILDPANILVLCVLDHVHLGHGGQPGRYYNPHVREDAEAIRADPQRRAAIERALVDRVVTYNPSAPDRRPPEEVAVTVVVDAPANLAAGRGVTAITAAEAATWLGISKARVFQIVAERDLAPIARRANVLFFDADRLRQIVAPRAVASNDEAGASVVRFRPPPAWVIEAAVAATRRGQRKAAAREKRARASARARYKRRAKPPAAT